MRKIGGALLVAAVAAVAAAAPAGAAKGARGSMREVILRAAEAKGIDGAALLGSQATVTVYRPDGTQQVYTQRMDEFIDSVVPDRPLGAGGGTEIVVGNLTHVFADFRQGTGGGYAVSQSAVIPSTPPVLLPPPATTLAYSVGGPVYNIKGSYNLLGLHMVGNLVGSNVSVTPGPPPSAVLPVPPGSGAFVPDSSIDFVGHAVFVQARVCFFGLCLTVGSILLSDGAALFDSSLPVGLPRLP